MTNIEAFAHIIDLANRTTDKTTYDYLMKEAQEIMSDAKTEDISYCDFAELVKERLDNKLQRSKLSWSLASPKRNIETGIEILGREKLPPAIQQGWEI